MHRVGDDFIRERQALRQTLMEVGPDAPTACGDWRTTELAIHVAIGELRGGWPTVPFRMMVNRGIRIDRLAGVNTGALRAYRRRGFDWAIERLARRPPRAHLRGRVVAVSLLEVWAHHEDVLDANDVGRCDSGVDLAPVVDVLRRYQRSRLGGAELPASLVEQARFLAGRTEVAGIRLSI
jgi:uncharacterized protein (TIGR03083 family)